MERFHSPSPGTDAIPRRAGWPRYVRWLALIATLFFAITAAVAYYVSWHLIHPARRPITRTPAAYGLKYRAIHFPSRIDHLRLSGWLLPPATASDRIVIEAHGYRQNRASDKPALPLAAALHRAGYGVLMFDFRDEGRSAGNEVTVGLYEQRDLLGAVDYVRALGYRHIGLVGYSMGATTALESAARDPAIGATVADSPIANFYRYLQRHMAHWTHLPQWPFTPEALLELRVIDHLDPARVDPDRQLRHFGQRPVLLIAGRADTTVPVSNSRTLAKVLRGDRNASLWLVPGAGHVGAYSADPGRYLHRVLGFFNRYL